MAKQIQLEAPPPKQFKKKKRKKKPSLTESMVG